MTKDWRCRLLQFPVRGDGAGVDELRWMKPVRPGEGEVVELIPSKTRPQGIARVKWTRSIRTARPSTPSIRSPSCRADRREDASAIPRR
jgi:hypothetical protein